MNKSSVIGITGGSGSGKTYFLQQLRETFTEKEVCILSLDNYYHPRETQPLDKNGIANFDTPQAFDIHLFLKDLKSLMSGQKIIKSTYTFNNPALISRNLEWTPAPVIIVEGIFILYFQELVELLDLKIFIDAKEHVKLSRRILRDLKERGYGHEDVLYRYEHHVAPAYEQFIEPYKYSADLILPNNQHFKKGLELIGLYIRNRNGEQRVEEKQI